MQSLKKLSKMKLTKNKIILLMLSLAGFFDSFYLTIVHYKHIIPPCTISLGCEKVLTSQFATIFGIPLGVFGVLFFLALIFLLLLGFNKYFKLLILAGIAVSIVLLYLQAFVLHAYCQYCLLVELIIFVQFILSINLIRRGNNPS